MKTESPSSVALWCACPGAYDLHYRQGVKAPSRPFFDLGREAAEDIDADGGGGPIKGERQLHKSVAVKTGPDKGDGGDRDPFINDRDPIFPAHLIAGLHKTRGRCADFFFHPAAGLADIPSPAVKKIDAHGHGAHIKIFLLDHFNGGKDMV